MKTRFTLFIAFIISYGLICAQTTISGGDVYGTWTTDNSPYLIEGDINVPADSLLEIEPGVSVAFQGAYIFHVYGMLNCPGTETDSITFYSATTPGYRGLKIMTDTNVMDSMFFTYCRFEGARCSGTWPDNCGGGIAIWEYDLIRIEHCLFKDNYAWTGSQAAGGAIATAGFNGIIRNNTFIDNRGLYGGAMIIFERSNPVISYNHFENNRASYEGGAIILWGNTDGPVHHNTFVGNRANAHGAAISFYDGCENNVHHNLFYDNTSIKKGGAVFLQQDCNPVFLNNTFVDNTANLSGGAIHAEIESSPRLINNIIWNNTSPLGCQMCIGDTLSIPDYFNNDIQFGKDSISGFHDLSEWKANIDEYPMFEDTLANIFHLSWGSPCLDAGVDSIYDPDLTISDLGAFWFDQTTAGISKANQSDFELIVYPNPSETEITISLSSECRVQSSECRVKLLDISGRVINEYNIINKYMRIDMSDLNAGVYIINVSIGKQSESQKLIKR